MRIASRTIEQGINIWDHNLIQARKYLSSGHLVSAQYLATYVFDEISKVISEKKEKHLIDAIKIKHPEYDFEVIYYISDTNYMNGEINRILGEYHKIMNKFIRLAEYLESQIYLTNDGHDELSFLYNQGHIVFEKHEEKYSLEFMVSNEFIVTQTGNAQKLTNGDQLNNVITIKQKKELPFCHASILFSGLTNYHNEYIKSLNNDIDIVELLNGSCEFTFH